MRLIAKPLSIKTRTNLYTLELCLEALIVARVRNARISGPKIVSKSLSLGIASTAKVSIGGGSLCYSKDTLGCNLKAFPTC